MPSGLALNQSEPADLSPIRFDWHAVSRAQAPELWAVLAGARAHGVDLARDDVVRVWLWAAYLSIVDVRGASTLKSVRHHTAKAARAITDFEEQADEQLRELGTAGRLDLEAAIRDRARGEATAIAADLHVARARQAGRSTVAQARWARVRSCFEGFDGLLDALERELAGADQTRPALLYLSRT